MLPSGPEGFLPQGIGRSPSRLKAWRPFPPPGGNTRLSWGADRRSRAWKALTESGSRDGLDLYCTYVPGDLLSWTFNSQDPTAFKPYLRGPTFGMDLVTNPVGAASWVHSDILHAHRASTDEDFTAWNLSGMARPVFSEGAPFPMGSDSRLVFTSNDNPLHKVQVWTAAGLPEPAGPGAPLAGLAGSGTFNQDNPSLTRIDASTLILFFDSGEYPGGEGDLDLWYALSTDDGATWGSPVNLAALNTSAREHQPFLHWEAGGWVLYYSAYFEGKLAIYRSIRGAGWDAWGSPELVVSAGNTAGVGEPSLTAEGDLAFILVYENPEGAPYSRYDGDPWCLRRVR